MWDRHELGECRSSQESVVHNLEISDLKLYSLCAEIFSSPEGYRKRNLTDGGVAAAPGTMLWKGARLGRNKDLDKPI
jgi:hypothetical protein